MKIAFQFKLNDGPKVELFENGTWRVKPDLYKIGDSLPNGDIVFFLLENSSGEHGFVCQKEDLAETHTRDGALYTCKALGNGWRLPTVTELNRMYENLKKNGLGGFSDESYWSSSEEGERAARWQYFGSGYQSSPDKDMFGHVRAVQAF